MATLKKKIVNANFQVIGFEVSGKAKEFGDIGVDIITRRLTINDLVKMGFENSQVMIDKNKIIHEKNNFKLRFLPTILYKDNKFTSVDSNITLLSRVLVDGELGGFDVCVSGENRRLKTPDVIRLAYFFNPTNFVVRYTNGKNYIAGKAGYALETLPEVKLTAKTAAKKKATRSATAQTAKGASVDYSNSFDIITLCGILDELGGKFLYLPGVVYKRTGELQKETSKEFRKTGVEISKADIALSEKKVNISLPFMQIGQVTVNVAGVDRQYYPFTYRDKVIFRGKEVNSPNIGIVLEKSKVDELQSRFGGSMGLSLITDPMTNLYVKMFLGVRNPDDYALLAVDTRNLTPMTKENANAYLQSEEAIENIIYKLLNVKIALSVVKRLRLKVEGLRTESLTGSVKPIYGPYRGCSEEELQALTDAGIDVFTGAFTKTEESTFKKSTTEGDENAPVDVEVAWELNGMKSAPKIDRILADPSKALKEKYPKALDIVNYALDIDNTPASPDEMWEKFKGVEERLQAERSNLIRAIQYHNIAGNVLGTFAKNKAGWTMTKTLKAGDVYEYSDGKLTCTIKNATI